GLESSGSGRRNVVKLPAAGNLDFGKGLGAGPTQGHEAAASDRMAGQIAVAALKGDRELGAVEGEGEQKAAIRLELGQPFRGNVPAGYGEDDAVIRGVGGIAKHAVAGNHLDAVETGRGEVGAGGF